MAAEKDASPPREPAEEPEPAHNPPRQPSQTKGNEKHHSNNTPSSLESCHQVSSHDAVPTTNDHHPSSEIDYDRFSTGRKHAIVVTLSFCAFLAPISSTSILAASPEVVQTYDTTATLFNISNALYMAFMGLSPLLYGPLATVFGRKPPLTLASVTFLAFSIGTALAPTFPAYFVFRLLTAFQGTCFLIVGGTVIGDIYHPIERGTAYGWFLSGTVIGPALGPFVGGILVTYASWRNIFWLQTALAGVACVGIFFVVPETIPRKRYTEIAHLPLRARARTLAKWSSPWRVLVLFRYPNIAVAGIASGSLVFNMYSLLSPIRLVLNPRFNLDSPLQSGLFYIAPGAGYIVGTLFGGRWADRTVRAYMARRDGLRVPEDRLHSCLPAMGIVLPACMLVYGWAVQKEAGGIALPVVAMFVQGVAQLVCFPSLNTYCLDVMQGRSSEVMAGNYVVRYAFAAVGTAVCWPVIQKIGVGWFSTVSAAFMLLAAGGTWATALWGSGWREGVGGGKGEDE